MEALKDLDRAPHPVQIRAHLEMQRQVNYTKGFDIVLSGSFNFTVFKNGTKISEHEGYRNGFFNSLIL